MPYRGRTHKSRGRSRTNPLGAYERIHPPLLPLDTYNEAYIAMREEVKVVLYYLLLDHLLGPSGHLIRLAQG